MAANKDQMISTVERFLSAYWDMDVPRTLELVTEDFRWINMPFQNFVIAGRAQLRDFMVNRNGGFPEPIEDGEHITRRAVAEGEILMAERLDRMKLRGHWIEIPCNAVWIVRSGMVALWQDYYDLGSYLEGMRAAGIELDPHASEDPSKWCDPSK